MNVRVLGNLARWSERRRPRASFQRRARVVGVDEDPQLRLARVPRLERLGPPVWRRSHQTRGLEESYRIVGRARAVAPPPELRL